MTPKKLKTRVGGAGQARSRRDIAAKYLEVAESSAAADLLDRVDGERGKKLRRLVGLKSASHHGERLIGNEDRVAALRDARALLDEAVRRTT